jgi:hypothetical protein
MNNADELPWHMDPNRRVCRNQMCVSGLVKVMVLLDTPEETRILAEHLPRSKPHVREAWVPCETCCGPRLHQAGLDRIRSQASGEAKS